jgi:hypothetical protein
MFVVVRIGTKALDAVIGPGYLRFTSSPRRSSYHGMSKMWLSDCELFGASFPNRPRSFLPMFNATIGNECQAESTTRPLGLLARELRFAETGK